MYEFFDPKNWGFGPDIYQAWWQYLLTMAFDGFIPRFLAATCLIVSIFSMVTRRFRPILAGTLFIISVIITYGGGMLRMFGIM